MLKWKNMRIFVLLIAMILGLSSVFIYLSIRGSMPSEAEKTGLFPAQYFQPIAGQEVSFDQAQASVPFKINMPTKMEIFVQLKLNGDAVKIICAAVKLSSDASYFDVLNQNGIILYEAPLSETYGTLQFAENNLRAIIDSTKDYSDGGLKPVTVNGYFGCVGGNVEHCVTWCTETTYYQLTASNKYPLQELVAMAQSIPVN